MIIDAATQSRLATFDKVISSQPNKSEFSNVAQFNIVQLKTSKDNSVKRYVNMDTLVKTDAYHVPVMTGEVLDGLKVISGGMYLDCNIGEGGHAALILSAARGVRLLGLDLDTAALEFAKQRLADYTKYLELVHCNFSEMSDTLNTRLFSGILFDLGVSSLQLDTPKRGFSFRHESALDMRFNPHTGITAHEIVNRFSEKKLAEIISKYGEEPRSRLIAKAIVNQREIVTTTQLAQIIQKAVNWSKPSRIHPATRTFQALRITVNGELENLKKGLLDCIKLLEPGGRLVVISYHSLEDRIVKNVMRSESSTCLCPPGLPKCVCDHVQTLERVTRRVVTPSNIELRLNPRARSAKLRIAQRIRNEL